MPSPGLNSQRNVAKGGNQWNERDEHEVGVYPPAALKRKEENEKQDECG